METFYVEKMGAKGEKEEGSGDVEEVSKAMGYEGSCERR